MATFVLVHGSFQGGWIWRKVADRLRAAGHLVYHPSLDGCGDRAHTLRPEITLNTHGQDISRLLFFECLKDVILVGTSSGGMVVAEAAQANPERIRRLVFIDALVPVPGETVATINGRPPHDASKMTYGPPIEDATTRTFMSIEPGELRAFAQARYTPHPRRPTEEPVDLRTFWELQWRADVLRCLRGSVPSEAHQRRTARLLRAEYETIDAGHYAMLTHHADIASYLLKHAQ